MSTDADMEVLRRIYGEWAEGRFWNVSDYDPEIEFVIRAGFPFSGTYKGLDGMETGFKGWLESWRDMRFVLERLYPAGERILATFHLTGVGRSSGLEAEIHGAHIWTMRDGLALRIEVYSDQPAAFEDAGVEDPDSKGPLA